MEPAAARHVGARLLAEIEEESLEELLKTIRTQLRAEINPGTRSDASSASRPPITTTHSSPTAQHSTTHLPLPPAIIPQPHIPFPALHALVARHQKATQSAPPPVLFVSGRYLPFIYHLVSTLISTPSSSRDGGNPGGGVSEGYRHCGYTVVIIDAECRFDVTRLVNDPVSPTHASTKGNNITTQPKHNGEREEEGEEEGAENTYQQKQPPTSFHPATPSDLRHVYIYRPAHSQVRAAIAAAGEFMLYGDHQSRAREWWGTIVVGSSGLSSTTTATTTSTSASTTKTTPKTNAAKTPADVLTGYKGWLRVDRAEQVPGFHLGISAEEALADRDRRMEAVDNGDGKWRASSRWGSYAFG